jgi:hypothetical protein
MWGKESAAVKQEVERYCEENPDKESKSEVDESLGVEEQRRQAKASAFQR